MHWRYETLMSPQLRAGRNVIAALVWNWGADKPVAQFSRQTAFLLQGDSAREAIVNSGPEWKVLRTKATPRFPFWAMPLAATTRLHRARRSTRSRYPWGWTQPTSRRMAGSQRRLAGAPAPTARSCARAIPSAKRAAGSSCRVRSRRWKSRRYGSRPFGGVAGSRPMRASSEERATSSCRQRPGQYSARPGTPHQCIRRPRGEWRCRQHRAARLR
jgi:hypothetical protein